MTNRLKPLLAFYAANRGSISRMASARMKASTEYAQIWNLTTGPGYAQRLRTAEMALGPDQNTARLISHHVRIAAEILAPFAEQLEQPFEKDWLSDPYPRRQRCKNIRNLPEHLLGRLAPVFSQNALFDPAGNFEKRFDAWHQSYTGQLNQVDKMLKKGKGSLDRRYVAYKAVFLAERPSIDAWFEKMLELARYPEELMSLTANA